MLRRRVRNLSKPETISPLPRHVSLINSYVCTACSVVNKHCSVGPAVLLSYQSSAFFLSTSNRLELLRVNSRHVPILITFDRPNQSPAVLCPGTRWLDAATDISPPLPPHGFVQSIPMGSLREAAADVLYIMNIYTIREYVADLQCVCYRLQACTAQKLVLPSYSASARPGPGKDV